MNSERMQRKWAQLGPEAFAGIAEWRVQHPSATFREIEAAVDERLAAVRVRMLEDAALACAEVDPKKGAATTEGRAVLAARAVMHLSRAAPASGYPRVRMADGGCAGPV